MSATAPTFEPFQRIAPDQRQQCWQWWRDEGDSIGSQMRTIGRQRWRKYGCCGFRELAFERDVVDMSESSETTITKCVRCHLLGERCVLGTAIGAAERLGIINRRNVRSVIDEWCDC